MNSLEKVVLVLGFILVGTGIYQVVDGPLKKKKDATEQRATGQESQDIDKNESEEDDV